jgi:hypothetical protein
MVMGWHGGLWCGIGVLNPKTTTVSQVLSAFIDAQSFKTTLDGVGWDLE